VQGLTRRELAVVVFLVLFFGWPVAVLGYYVAQPMPKHPPPQCDPRGFCWGCDNHGHCGYALIFSPR